MNVFFQILHKGTKRDTNEIEFSLYVEQFKLAGLIGTKQGVKSFVNFTKSPYTVNVFLRDTDIGKLFFNYSQLKLKFKSTTTRLETRSTCSPHMRTKKITWLLLAA